MTASSAPQSHGEKEDADLNRRSFLATGLQWSLATGVLYAATTRAATLCVDPDDLSSADYQFRKYVEYTEASKNEAQSCGNCMFFKPGPGDCGSCQVVAGSINSHGHCTSWAAREPKK